MTGTSHLMDGLIMLSCFTRMEMLTMYTYLSGKLVLHFPIDHSFRMWLLKLLMKQVQLDGDRCPQNGGTIETAVTPTYQDGFYACDVYRFGAVDSNGFLGTVWS